MFEIKFCIDNDAFVEDDVSEITRILRNLIDIIDGSGTDEVKRQGVIIRDINGNSVGWLKIRE